MNFWYVSVMVVAARPTKRRARGTHRAHRLTLKGFHEDDVDSEGEGGVERGERLFLDRAFRRSFGRG